MKIHTSFLVVLFLFSVAVQAQKKQEPLPPFSYPSEEITFVNPHDSVKLAGTLTLPKGKTDFPTVVLISGSGAQDRNCEILGHKPFLVIADYFARNGIAVLRVDDRGTGLSQGVHNASHLDDFAKDTEAAIAYLKTRIEINTEKIGLMGHSLGGIIAPLVAGRNTDVAFVVLLAAPGIPGDQLMMLQKATVERKMGIPETAVEAGQKNIGGAYALILKIDDNTVLQDSLQHYFTRAFGSAMPASQIETLSKQLCYPWLTDMIRYNPAVALAKTTCPLLALNGTNDLQVPYNENLEAIRKYTAEGGNKNVTIRACKDLNHLFQESTTGMPQEYGTLEETFSEEVMGTIAKWINEKSGK